MSDELMTKVQALVDSTINPAVAGHGGFVQLVGHRFRIGGMEEWRARPVRRGSEPAEVLPKQDPSRGRHAIIDAGHGSRRSRGGRRATWTDYAEPT
jgi:hypothetical protein